jgi:hypothetical protein
VIVGDSLKTKYANHINCLLFSWGNNIFYEWNVLVNENRVHSMSNRVGKCCLETAHQLTHPEFTPCFSGIRVTRSLLFCVVFCWWLIVLLKFFFWPLRCLSFDLRILITHLVSGNSSFNHKTFKFIYRYQYIYCNWLLSVNLFVLFFD